MNKRDGDRAYKILSRGRGALFAKAVQFSGDMKGRREALKEFEAICDDYDIVSLVEASKSADQVGDLVRRVTAEINATPVIIIAMIVAAALTLFAAAAAAGALYGKVRYRSAAVFKLLAASKWSECSTTGEGKDEDNLRQNAASLAAGHETHRQARREG